MAEQLRVLGTAQEIDDGVEALLGFAVGEGVGELSC